MSSAPLPTYVIGDAPNACPQCGSRKLDEIELNKPGKRYRAQCTCLADDCGYRFILDSSW